MTYKTIVVHLDDSHDATSLLNVAIDIADRDQAHLIGLYVTPPLQSYLYSELPVPAVVHEYHATYHETLAAKLREQFEQCTRDRAFVSEWHHAEANTLAVHTVVAEQGHTADLLIVGQKSTEDRTEPVNPALDTLIPATGRPVMVVPCDSDPQSVGRVVFVAWDGGIESTRAVFDSLPLLQRAEKVIVHRVNPGSFERHHLLGTLSEMVNTLSRHGVLASLSHSDSAAGEVADELLQTTFEQGADLLVMGAYGKHRLRDLIHGSTTRRVLQQMKVPVLFSH
jgi:nucleotide-binding universal stress UspA family protein